MKILITGGAGFIGSHLARLLQHEAEVRVLDDLSTGDLSNLEGLNVDFQQGSILKDQAVRLAVKDVDYVFHLAARVGVAESMEQPEKTVLVNTTGTLKVLRAAAEAKASKLVLASSAAIYGDDPTVPKVETICPRPNSPYAVTKLDAEYYCAMFTQQKWLPTASLRFFNVFGQRQRLNGPYAAVVPAFITRALKGEPLVVHGDGDQTRDFIYVQDIVSALRFIGIASPATGIFNCGYGKMISINRLTEEIIRLTDSTSAIRHSRTRPGDVRHSLASVDRLRGLGWTPTGDFETGLAETVTFFRRFVFNKSDCTHKR